MLFFFLGRENANLLSHFRTQNLTETPKTPTRLVILEIEMRDEELKGSFGTRKTI